MTSSLLNQIKIEIRSLLISSPHGLNEDELCRDYSLFNSQRLLPYKILGYSTVKDFLNSLTDILYRSSNGFIYPIADQSNEHILKLVQQQRKTKQKKKIKKTTISYGQQHHQRNQSKPCNKRKRVTATSIISASQQMHATLAPYKLFTVSIPMKYHNDVKKQTAQFRSESVINNPSAKFERVNITNEFLQRLLIHFRQQKN